MEDLTFGEQVKVVLSRKGMTIKELAEIIEEKTGMKMSRQNLTQRLGRDKFSGAGYADDRVDLRLSVSAEYFRRRIC